MKESINSFIELGDKVIEQEEEIKRLEEQLNDEIEDELKQSEIMLKQHNEIERLHSIIKEVREYIEGYNLEHLHEINEHNLADILEELLEILDKENK